MSTGEKLFELEHEVTQLGGRWLVLVYLDEKVRTQNLDIAWYDHQRSIFVEIWTCTANITLWELNKAIVDLPLKMVPEGS